MKLLFQAVFWLVPFTQILILPCASAAGDDASRLLKLEQQVTALTTIIDEQSEKISDLTFELRRQSAKLNKMAGLQDQLDSQTEQLSEMRTLLAFNAADVSLHTLKIDSLEENAGIGPGGQRHHHLIETLYAVANKISCISDESDDTKLLLNSSCLTNLVIEYPCFTDQNSVERALKDILTAELFYGPIYSWCFEEVSLEQLVSKTRASMEQAKGDRHENLATPKTRRSTPREKEIEVQHTISPPSGVNQYQTDPSNHTEGSQRLPKHANSHGRHRNTATHLSFH